MNKQRLAIIVIIFSAILGVWIGFNDSLFMKVETNSNNLVDNSGESDNSKDNIFSGDILNSGDEDFSNDNTSDKEEKDIRPVRAVYATGWAIGTPSIRESMITSLKENGFNAIVIDIKDEAGQLSYDSKVQTAIDTNASKKMIRDITAVINEFKENDIYVIGRIVTFKDPNYASKVSSISYKTSDGSIWKDYSGNAWPNPYNRETWNYPIELAKEAAALGFEEIQFDYIRFPSSEGRTSQIVYGFDKDTKTKADIISEYLEKVMKELEPYDVTISADVFGIITKRDGDFENIGQDFSRIAGIVDVICPMVYPSHYNFNEYKISKPDRNPYEIVYNALDDAYERLETYTSGDKTKKVAKIRPYLQDFTASWLGSGNYLTYGTEEVRKQIQASYDLGIYDFTLWDPSNKYCYSALEEVIINEVPSRDKLVESGDITTSGDNNITTQ